MLLGVRQLATRRRSPVRPNSNYYGLLPILSRLRTLLQHLAVPDGAFAGVAGELEVLSELKGIGRTGVLAEAAKHAAAQVVGEVGKFFAAGLLIALAGDHDQILRTPQRAQVAGHGNGLICNRGLVQP